MITNKKAPYRPALIACINAIGRTLGRNPGSGKWLNADKLMKSAMRKEGLSDFGDPGFRQCLERLADSVVTEARLNSFGRFMEKQNLTRILRNRLRMENDIKKHPEIETIRMEDPVFIAGLQRTGTTMLQRLLSADERFRFVRSWEAINPAPFRGAVHFPDKRIGQARMAQRALRYLSPAFFAIHPVEALDPEEDCLLFDLDFTSTVPEATQRVPSFSRWLESFDHEWAYARFARILRYLYWQQTGGRWLLKTPQHLEHLPELFRAFPDARLIQTHRDPARVIASFSSMIYHGYGIFSDILDPREIAGHWLAKAELMVRGSMEIRDKVGPEHFIDVYYHNLMKDPVGEIGRIYDALKMSFTEKNRDLVLRWVSQNPQHKHGTHSYRLEDYGLDRETIREKFRPYIDRFGIPEE